MLSKLTLWALGMVTFIALSFASCKTYQPTTSEVTKDSIIERFTFDTAWMQLPGDSALIEDFIKCDSANQAQTAEIVVLKNKQKISIKVVNGKLTGRFVCLADSYAAVARYRELQHYFYKKLEKPIVITERIYPHKFFYWWFGVTALLIILFVIINLIRFLK